MKKDIRGYLQDMLARIDRIFEFSRGGPEDFFASAMMQDAILLKRTCQTCAQQCRPCWMHCRRRTKTNKHLFSAQ